MPSPLLPADSSPSLGEQDSKQDVTEIGALPSLLTPPESSHPLPMEAYSTQTEKDLLKGANEIEDLLSELISTVESHSLSTESPLVPHEKDSADDDIEFLDIVIVPRKPSAPVPTADLPLQSVSPSMKTENNSTDDEIEILSDMPPPSQRRIAIEYPLLPVKSSPVSPQRDASDDEIECLTPPNAPNRVSLPTTTTPCDFSIKYSDFMKTLRKGNNSMRLDNRPVPSQPTTPSQGMVQITKEEHERLLRIEELYKKREEKFRRRKYRVRARRAVESDVSEYPIEEERGEWRNLADHMDDLLQIIELKSEEYLKRKFEYEQLIREEEENEPQLLEDIRMLEEQLKVTSDDALLVMTNEQWEQSQYESAKFEERTNLFTEAGNLKNESAKFLRFTSTLLKNASGRANDSKYIQRMKYTRKCHRCQAPNPLLRVVMSSCGHIFCVGCVEKMKEKHEDIFVECYTCKSYTNFVRILEEPIEEEPSRECRKRPHNNDYSHVPSHKRAR